MTVLRFVALGVLVAGMCGCDQKPGDKGQESSWLPGMPKSLFGGLMDARSEAQEMARKGRKLWEAITAAQVDRMNAGMCASLWPQSANNLSDDSEDISGKPFSCAEKYFEELFDVMNANTEEHNPYVKGIDPSVLSGGGRPALPPGRRFLSEKYCAWAVLKGVSDDLPDNFPVLATANLDVRAIPLAGTIDGRSTQMVGIDPSCPFAILDNQYVVVVRKDGSTDVIPAKEATIGRIFQGVSCVIKSDLCLEFLLPSRL